MAGRLAWTENSLDNLADASDSSDSERVVLQIKRDKLAGQLEEAKRLKENIDRRSEAIVRILEKYLTEGQVAEYGRFVANKARLIMEVKEMEDKIKLSEEQLSALKDEGCTRI